MSGIALAAAAEDLEALVAEATGGAHVVLAGPLDQDAGAMLARLSRADLPEVLLLDARGDAETALSLATQLDQQHPEIVLLLATDLSQDLGLAAMRAGVRDLIDVASGVAGVRSALDHALATSGRLAPPTQPRSRIITVVSAKGGAGKTTIATNLAVALARTVRHSTVLVDLNLQFGDVDSALNLTPAYSLADALPSVADGDSISLKSYLATHKSGLYVLPAPEHPAEADSVTGEQVGQLLQMLATEFTYVVVDTSPGLSGHTLAALDHTTDPLLVTPLSVSGIRGSRKISDTFRQLQMFGEDQVHVIVSFADAADGLSTDDVTATLQTPTLAALPTSRTAPASSNLGEAIMESRPRAPLAKALSPLASRYLPEGVDLAQGGRHRRRRKKK